MVTLRGNPKTGIQKSISFDREGEGTTSFTKLSQQEEQRLRQRFEDEKRERDRIWRFEPTKKRKIKAEAKQPPQDQQDLQQIQPQQQKQQAQLTRHQQSVDPEYQGLSKAQRRKARKQERNRAKQREAAARLSVYTADQPSHSDNSNRNKSLALTKHRLPLVATITSTRRGLEYSGSMSGGETFDNIIDDPSASAAHQRARNSGQSFTMNEPVESRTAAVGRKRKKGDDLRSQLGADKRRRLEAGEGTDGDEGWDDDKMHVSDYSSAHDGKEDGEVLSGDEEDDDYLPAAHSNSNAKGSGDKSGAKKAKARANPITISSDDDDVQIVQPPASTKPSGPTMTLHDLKHTEFRTFIENKIKHTSPSMSVEAAVRHTLERGTEFTKPARLTMSNWKARVKESKRLAIIQKEIPSQQVKGSNQQAKALESDWAPEDMQDILAACNRHHYFARSMTLKDLRYNHLRKHIAALKLRDHEILPTLCTIAMHRKPFGNQARRAAVEFSRECYIGPITISAGFEPTVPRGAGKQTAQATPTSARPRQSAVSDAPSVGEAPEIEMEDDLPGLANDSGDDSDDAPSVGESPAAQDHDYGSLARNAAAFTPLNDNGPPSLVRMYEISDDQQALQYRYYHITDPNALVRCLCCGEQGHLEDDCPEHTCKHCGAQYDHFSYNCPEYVKCRRCRQRGQHDESACQDRFVQPGAANDPCDVCGRPGHVEEECARLWCSFNIKDDDVVKVPRGQMITDCYNCGGHDHFGDDCPDLPDYAKGSQDGRVWSMSYAIRFVEGDQEPAAGQYGNGYNYQMAQLDDMRD